MPYCAICRSHTEVIIASSPEASLSLRAGILRTNESPSSGLKCGNVTSTTQSLESIQLSSASISLPAACSKMFHLPSSPQRKPTDPFGATNDLDLESNTIVFHSGLLSSPRLLSKSDARRNRPVTVLPSTFSRIICIGKSVKLRAYSAK